MAVVEESINLISLQLGQFWYVVGEGARRQQWQRIKEGKEKFPDLQQEFPTTFCRSLLLLMGMFVIVESTSSGPLFTAAFWWDSTLLRSLELAHHYRDLTPVLAYNDRQPLPEDCARDRQIGVSYRP